MEFEPLTFEEFALVFELSAEDVKSINDNIVLKQWIIRAIEFANTHPGIVHRAFKKLEDERCNSGFYEHFAKRLKQVNSPDLGVHYTGITEDLSKKFDAWYARQGGIISFYR